MASRKMTRPTRSAALCVSVVSIIACASTNLNGAHAFVVSPLSPITASPTYFPSATRGPLRTVLRRTSSQKIKLILVTKNEHEQDGLFLTSSSAQSTSNDPRLEPRITYEVTVDLPLGLVIQEMDPSDPSFGVTIIGINDEGNAARHNSGTMDKIKSQGGIFEVGSDSFICIRDKIVAVNGTPCPDRGFDDVISMISSVESKEVTLELGRIRGSTVVNYCGGVCISAKVGESYGFLAEKCGVDIDYECRTGNCQTCVRRMEFPDKERDLSPDEGKGNLYERTIFHCVGRVPRGYQWLHVLGPCR